MREKEKWAIEYAYAAALKKEKSNAEPTAKEIAAFAEEMFLIGFNLAKEKLMDLCDSKQQVVGFMEINRLGEKQAK